MRFVPPRCPTRAPDTITIRWPVSANPSAFSRRSTSLMRVSVSVINGIVYGRTPQKIAMRRRTCSNGVKAMIGAPGRCFAIRHAVAPDSLTRNDLADRAVTNRELSNPIFTAAVDSDGTVSSAQSVGVDQSLTRKIDQVGGGVIYDVGFQQDVSQCVYSATPGRTRRGGTLSPVFLNPQTRASNPRIVTVFVRDEKGSFFTPERPSFHLIVVC